MFDNFKPWKNEKEFTTNHLWLCKSLWSFTFKIPDIWNTLKPFDAIVMHDWTSYAIEYKYQRASDVLSIVEPHQRYALVLYQRNWWTSLIIHYHKTSIYYYKISHGWTGIEIITKHECLN